MTLNKRLQTFANENKRLITESSIGKDVGLHHDLETSANHYELNQVITNNH